MYHVASILLNGLRSYNTEPQIWGGSEFCDHEWGESLKYAKQDNRTLEQKIAQGATVGSNQKFNDENTTATSGAFCINCNAWRGELGLEPDFRQYIAHLIEIFAEVKRVLKPDGTCWVNLGDSYAAERGGTHMPAQTVSGGNGGKGDDIAFRGMGGETRPAAHRNARLQGLRHKSLMNIPARFAIAMTDELGFVQRNEIIWLKPACMPSSAKDRFTVDFEPIFFFSKNPKYKFNQQLEPIKPESLARYASGYKNYGIGQFNGSPTDTRSPKEITPEQLGQPEGRNKRTTWKVNFEPSGDEHYASYPTKLCETPILASTDEGDTVLDPFAGTGTTLLTALRNRRNAVGIELQPKYVEIVNRRLKEIQVNLF